MNFRLLTTLALASTLLAAASRAAEPIKYHLCDCHLHLADFLQHTDGAKAALAAMDAAGIDDTMVCGMPLVKEWSPSAQIQPQYYLDDDSRCYWYSATDVLVEREVSGLPADQRKRFHPFICGINAADKNAVEHVRRMLEWYPGFWQGIGEIMTRHDDLTALTYGDVAHADSPSLDPIYKLAAEHDLPVSVHCDISSVWRREPIYLPEIENAVHAHPETRFIWCHAGISRRIEVPTLTKELRRMLKTYPNLWIDIAWVVFEDYIDKGGKVDADWTAMLEEFPDRFIIGSDKVGHFATYPQEMQKYYALLDTLKPETARKVGHDNFLSVLPKPQK